MFLDKVTEQPKSRRFEKPQFIEAATPPLAAVYESSTVAKATVLHREYTYVMSKIQKTTLQQPELLSLCDVVPEFPPADREVPGGRQGIPC